jgi:hypothetical protein
MKGSKFRKDVSNRKKVKVVVGDWLRSPDALCGAVADRVAAEPSTSPAVVNWPGKPEPKAVVNRLSQRELVLFSFSLGLAG